MIESNEMRLGNLVHRRGEAGVVVSLDAEEVGVRFGGVYGDYERHYFESIDPIDLTPEILGRCGFEDIRGEYVIFNGICIYNDDERYFFADEDAHEGNINYFGNGFLYVHELQNLYFALSGEELNVKL